MTEADKRIWDVCLGVATPVLAVVGIIVGVLQFNAGEADKNRIEFQQKLWLERLAACKSTAELAGNIVTHVNDKSFGELQQQFTSSYWGTVILVEDDKIENSMIDFNTELREFRDGFGTTDDLKISAYELVKACKNSLERQNPGRPGSGRWFSIAHWFSRD